ncbi:hypothetical protein ABPG74_002585 [Tetrahymena malaccensis]
MQLSNQILLENFKEEEWDEKKDQSGYQDTQDKNFIKDTKFKILILKFQEQQTQMHYKAKFTSKKFQYLNDNYYEVFIYTNLPGNRYIFADQRIDMIRRENSFLKTTMYNKQNPF